MLKQFLYDMINLTEGQKFVKYWWLWLVVMILISVYWLVKDK